MHSNEQMKAPGASAGKSVPQRSQSGRISSMAHYFPFGSSLSRILRFVLDKLEPNGGRNWNSHAAALSTAAQTRSTTSRT